MNNQSDGVLKSKIWREKLQNSKSFRPNKFHLDYFEKNPSTISERPLTPGYMLYLNLFILIFRTIDKIITLDRNKEKKFFKPNKQVI